MDLGIRNSGGRTTAPRPVVSMYDGFDPAGGGARFGAAGKRDPPVLDRPGFGAKVESGGILAGRPHRRPLLSRSRRPGVRRACDFRSSGITRQGHRGGVGESRAEMGSCGRRPPRLDVTPSDNRIAMRLQRRLGFRVTRLPGETEMEIICRHPRSFRTAPRANELAL